MTMPEMALGFVLSEKRVSTIIPGMRKLNHVETNIATSDAGPLPEDLHAKLRSHRWAECQQIGLNNLESTNTV